MPLTSFRSVRLRPSCLALAVTLGLCPVGGVAQSTTTVPSVCATLPGNAAVSMPLRWSHGTMQVFIEAGMLPASLNGQTLTGMRLRRSTLLGEVGYPALQRTLTIRGGFQPFLAAQMQGSIVQNRPSNAAVLFGPAVVTIAASPAPSATTVVGDAFVDIDFTTPLPMGSGTLFLELEAGDAPLSISSGHWVDAVWMQAGDGGYAATVGTGGCTSRPEPTVLRWGGGLGPTPGTAAPLRVEGLPPSALVLHWLGLDPQGAGAGFGLPLLPLDPTLVGCYAWAPLAVSWTSTANAQGVATTSFAVPGSTPAGTRFGVQSAWLDLTRPSLPFSFSNGLVLVSGTAGIGTRCGTMFFPGTAQTSPWPIYLGQMPVLQLKH